MALSESFPEFRPFKRYHPRTALGALVQRMRQEKRRAQDIQRLSERPTLMRTLAEENKGLYPCDGA